MEDLNLDKTESIDPVVDGTQLTYQVKVRNDGPDNATGIVVQKTLGPLPPHVTIHSTNVSQGSYVSGTGVWTLGNLANGATATLTMVLDVGPFAPYQAVIHNSAAITAQDPPDPNTSNNQDTEDTTITAPQCIQTPRPTRTPAGSTATPFQPTPSPTPFCLTGPTSTPTASPTASPSPPPGTGTTARPTRSPHPNTFAALSRLAEFW